MAKKIETLTFKYRTKTRQKEFSLDIFLSADMDFYYQNKQLPQEFHDNKGDRYYGKREHHSTYRELREELKALVQEYEEAVVVETKTKILAYEIKLQGEVNLLPHEMKGKGKERSFERFTDLHGRGYGLQVSWEIYWRAKKGGKTSYYSYYTRGEEGKEHIGHETHLDGDEKEMEWTPARQAWFENLDRSLELLVKNVNIFFNENPIELTAIIDSGRLLSFTPAQAQEKKP